MKDTLRADAERLVAKWAPRLGLQDREIAVSVRPLKQTWAQTTRNGDSRRARITVHKGFRQMRGGTSNPDLERTLVHELLHVAMSDFAETADHVLDTKEGRIHQSHLEGHEERLVDGLAIALVRWSRSS